MAEGRMLLWIIAAVTAFFIKGLCGFANTLVFSTILSFRVDNVLISPVELLLGYLSNLVIAWKERKNVDLRVCVPLIVIVLLGDIPGMLLLKNADAGRLRLLFGIVIVLVALEMLSREMRKDRRDSAGSRAVLVLVGVLSGFFCGLFGIGALMAAYMSRVTSSSASFRGNLCLVFFLENTLRILFYIFFGILHVQVLKTAVMLLPFMLLGLAAGMYSARILPEKVIRKLILLLLVISGMTLILGNLPKW